MKKHRIKTKENSEDANNCVKKKYTRKDRKPKYKTSFYSSEEE